MRPVKGLKRCATFSFEPRNFESSRATAQLGLRRRRWTQMLGWQVVAAKVARRIAAKKGWKVAQASRADVQNSAHRLQRLPLRILPRLGQPAAAAMSAQSAAKINSAVRDCLGRCYWQQEPLSVVADYMSELRRRPGWTEAELITMEATVLKMLKAMTEPAAVPADSDFLTWLATWRQSSEKSEPSASENISES